MLGLADILPVPLAKAGKVENVDLAASASIFFAVETLAGRA